MAHEAFGRDESYSAENDLSTKQFYAVELSAEGVVDVCDGATDKVQGILQNKPKTGESATVREIGISKAVVDGNSANVAVGDWLGTSATGTLVKKSTNNDLVCAKALEAVVADGIIASVEVFRPFSLGA